MPDLTLPQPAATLATLGVYSHVYVSELDGLTAGDRVVVCSDATPANIAVYGDDVTVAGGSLWLKPMVETLADGILLPLSSVVGSALIQEVLPVNPDHKPPCVDFYNHGFRRRGEAGDGRYLVHYQGESLVEGRTDITDQLPFWPSSAAPGGWVLVLTDPAPTTDRCPECWCVPMSDQYGRWCLHRGVRSAHSWEPGESCPPDRPSCPRCDGAGSLSPYQREGER